MRFALALGLIAAGGLLLYELVGVIEVLALALIIALILDPTVNLLVRLRFPRFVALLVVLPRVRGRRVRAPGLHRPAAALGAGQRLSGTGPRCDPERSAVRRGPDRELSEFGLYW
jgi:hypothetical protein